MTEKNKDENTLTECPVCKRSVMNKNLSQHLSKVHSLDKTQDNIDEAEKKDEKINLKDEIYLIREELRVNKRQRNLASVLFVTIIILLPVAYAITAPTEMISTSQSSNSNQGFDSVSDFTAVDVVTGETISLSQYKGSNVILNFVNYGCNQRTNQIVSAQLMDIKSLTEQRDDFIPVSVFCGCCPVETLRNFATENDLTWPWILDSDYSIIQEYAEYVEEYGYPTLVFINKDQYIYDYGGYYDISALSTMIDEML